MREARVTYAEWIAAYVEKFGDVTGLCEEATVGMLAQFSELKRVRGHVRWQGQREKPWPHWWCVAPDGSIVDPTVEQFPAVELVYEAWDERRPEPTGKCHDCGDYVFGGSEFCSQKCAASTAEYLNRRRPA